MDYKQKYLKYKTKYLQLKEQLGGSFFSQGYNWMKKKASDKYDCYMRGHSRICNGLLDAYLKNIKQSGDKLKIALQEEYETLVEEHNNNVYETATDEDYNQREIDTHPAKREMKKNIDTLKLGYEQVQRTKITYVGKFYDYLAECINQKCVSIDWNKYPGLIDFLESDFCLKQAGTSNENKTLKISFDNRQKNLDQTAIDNWNKPKKETKEENNNNTTKENNDTKEENNVLSKEQINDIRTKGFSEGPGDEFYIGGFSDLTNWYYGTCNEIQLKINNMYKKLLNNYTIGDMYKPPEIMEKYFRSIKIKSSYEPKNMTKEELEIYNEIKGYSCLWRLYKEKLLEKKKNFCKENDKLAEPDENVHDGGVMTAYHWVTRTCNEIHEKINAIYQNYKSKDENSADAQMGGEFTRIRNYEKKEKMTEEEKNLYNEIKQYDFNWNKYKKKLEEKNFCEEKKK